jgi:colanic acid biosynthesis glycosyl transferase WcaI
VKFFVVGAGAYVKQLQALSYDAGLTNIEFKPLQAWEDVPAMLSMADVHLVVQRKGAADSVLPSKLTNILSAGGNAVVTAESDTELGRLAEQYPGIYSCVGPEDIDAFCKGLDVELGNTGTNTVARKYAEENLNKDAILSRFREDLLNLVNEEITEN